MSDYDALRKVINHEANQEDDGGFFAQLGGIQPDHDDDGPTAKGLFQSVDFARNSYAYQYDPKIMPKKTWIDHMIDAFKPQPKRNPYMTIRRSSTYGGNLGTRHTWWVYCKKCPRSGLIKAVPISLTSTWQEAITTATHHAHIHHRSQK